MASNKDLLQGVLDVYKNNTFRFIDGECDIVHAAMDAARADEELHARQRIVDFAKWCSQNNWKWNTDPHTRRSGVYVPVNMWYHTGGGTNWKTTDQLFIMFSLQTHQPQ